MAIGGASAGSLTMKHLSLVTLTFQNSALILIMHYSRIMPLVNGHRYLASTSVLLNEAIKLVISAAVALFEVRATLPPNAPTAAIFRGLIADMFANDSWKLAVPAALYTLQNTLQYVAVSNLDPSTFQVTYQLKILTTAIFSVMLLGRRLSVKRWGSLLLLILGVSIVQLPQHATEATLEKLKDSSSKIWHRSLDHAVRSPKEEGPEMNRSVGLIAVLISCALSGLAGVLFEKILKESHSVNTKPVSLWVRNCQLSFWSLFPALFLGVMWVDGEKISKDGFFAGYNFVVWTAIMFQAAGGLIVALVIKYADNIAKNFATSISIVVSAIASAYFFDFVITVGFLIGTAVVMLATYLYSQPEHPRPSTHENVEYTELQETMVDRNDTLNARRSTGSEGSSSMPGSPVDQKYLKRDA